MAPLGFAFEQPTDRSPQLNPLRKLYITSFTSAKDATPIFYRGTTERQRIRQSTMVTPQIPVFQGYWLLHESATKMHPFMPSIRRR